MAHPRQRWPAPPWPPIAATLVWLGEVKDGWDSSGPVRPDPGQEATGQCARRCWRNALGQDGMTIRLSSQGTVRRVNLISCGFRICRRQQQRQSHRSQPVQHIEQAVQQHGPLYPSGRWVVHSVSKCLPCSTQPRWADPVCRPGRARHRSMH